METQNIKKIQVSMVDEPKEALKPARIKIQSVEVSFIEQTKANKVICLCKHPNREEPIKISTTRYESDGKLHTTGLWVNTDSKNEIKKASALGRLLIHLGCVDIEALEGKECDTCEGEDGYLCLKAY